mmetsp:Transcript_20631/g.44646  ORF Transcript_20631/g.44646 Transcript_20631/m.44646 type:complete len:99 (+) Transcript_20631:594-890(+)
MLIDHKVRMLRPPTKSNQLRPERIFPCGSRLRRKRAEPTLYKPRKTANTGCLISFANNATHVKPISQYFEGAITADYVVKCFATNAPPSSYPTKEVQQ